MQIRDGEENKSGARAFVEAIGPGAVGRCAWETDQASRDLELLWWIGRHRFVTAEQIAARLGCSVQRARARVRRLEQHGLVGCERAHLSQSRAVFLTGRGHGLLGLPRRRAPRAQIQREHEATIVDLALELERRAGASTLVLTERECRQHDRAAADGHRYGVAIAGAGRGDQHRWPDLVIQTPTGRTAVELELTPKGTSRLRAIIAATAPAATPKWSSSPRARRCMPASPSWPGPAAQPSCPGCSAWTSARSPSCARRRRREHAR